MNVIGELFGFAGGIIGIAIGVPQMIRVRRQGTSAGLALSPWILMLATYSAFTAYGIMQDSPALWVCNLLTFFTTALVITAVKGNGVKIWLTMLVGGAVSAVTIVSLPALLSNIVLVVLAANRLPQLVKTWKNRHKPFVSAVSISSLVVTFISLSFWELYALFTDHKFILVTTTVPLVIAVFTALLEVRMARAARQVHTS